MEQNRFFRIVSRFNGIAIMLILIAIIIFGGFNIIKELFYSRKPIVIKNVAEDPKGEEKWRLGSITELGGTDYIYLPLESEKKDVSVSGMSLAKSGMHEYYFNPSRNILFVNKKTQEMSWLFKNNKQLINKMELVAKQKKYDNQRNIEAIIYQVVTRDTNGDGKLSTDDSADVAISYPDGSNYREIIKSVERLIGVLMLDDGELLIMYQSNGNGYTAKIKVGKGNNFSVKEMPKI